MKGTFTFRILSSSNGTLTAQLLSTSNYTTASTLQDYDATGAVYYILAVIFMYGCSIIMMIGSFVKKSSPADYTAAYVKDLQSLEKLQLQQEKFRTKLQMHQKKVKVINVI